VLNGGGFLEEGEAFEWTPVSRAFAVCAILFFVALIVLIVWYIANFTEHNAVGFLTLLG